MLRFSLIQTCFVVVFGDVGSLTAQGFSVPRVSDAALSCPLTDQTTTPAPLTASFDQNLSNDRDAADAAVERRQKNTEFWDVMLTGGKSPSLDVLLKREALSEECVEALEKADLDWDIREDMLKAVAAFRTASHTVFQHLKQNEDRVKKSAEESAKKISQGRSSSDTSDSFRTSNLDWFETARDELVSKTEVQLQRDRMERLELLTPLMETEQDALSSVLDLVRETTDNARKVRMSNLYRVHRETGEYESLFQSEKHKKTPEDLVELSDKLSKEVWEVRKDYMGMILSFAHAIVANFGGGDADADAKNSGTMAVVSSSDTVTMSSSDSASHVSSSSRGKDGSAGSDTTSHTSDTNSPDFVAQDELVPRRAGVSKLASVQRKKVLTEDL